MSQLCGRVRKVLICKEEKMFKPPALFAVAAILAAGVPNTPTSTAGSWRVDARHSDAQLVTDATTDYGKTKINITLGFGRVSGGLQLDDADPSKSKVDLHIYPATSMAPPIEEDGNFKAMWLANLANHTLVCFHSKKVVRTPDGKLQTTGDLTLTRVDRNLQLDPNEGYAGPIYGPPVIHRVSREATFVFDLSPVADKGQKNGTLLASASTTETREGFPQLLRAVLATYWPPVVEDEKCQAASGGSEDYRGAQCTGSFLHAPGLPLAPGGIPVGEDYPAPSNFSAVVGSQLTIQLHMQLTPQASGQKAGGSD
jgi:polyisoprenoid-binding protein YceI